MAEPSSVDAALARIQQLAETGLRDQAESYCRELAQKAPREYRFWSWLGVLTMTNGQLDEAESAFRRASELESMDCQNWSNLGTLLIGKTHYSEAEGCFQRAIQLDPANVTYWTNLATSLVNQQKCVAAAEALRQVVAIEPRNAVAWSNLAEAEVQCGNGPAAREAYERSLTIAPTPGVALNFAALLARLNESQLAMHILRQVVEQVPSLVPAWQSLGDALSLVGDHNGAEMAYRKVLEREPQSRKALYSLGIALEAQFKFAEAEMHARGLLESEPHDEPAWELLASTQLGQGRAAEALESRARAVALSDDPAGYGRALLTTMQYVEDIDPQRLLVEHRKWDEKFARAFSRPFVPLSAAHDANRPLRIGLLSANFGRHPIAFLALPALKCLDKTCCTIVCYSDRIDEDSFTAEFRSSANEWHVVRALSDDELAQKIRLDEIDVLVDLMGHTGRRIFVVARRPAPVQATWLGYVGTTGLSAVDFLLADRFHVRPGEESWYSETVLRFPDCYACYGPPSYMPEVSPLPAASSGRFTFGSFNNPAKLNPQLLDAWATILRRVPSSQLLLKFGGLNQAITQAPIRARFARQGIAPERILMEGGVPHAEMLATYQRVDLALDTQPYSGGLTTCEALWMGVPVVTFPGRTFAGRHSVSYLTNAGHGQFVASDLSTYVELAIEWASRQDELTAIRGQLREHMRQSPVCDAPGFAGDFLALLQSAYKSRAVIDN